MIGKAKATADIKKALEKVITTSLNRKEQAAIEERCKQIATKVAAEEKRRNIAKYKQEWERNCAKMKDIKAAATAAGLHISIGYSYGRDDNNEYSIELKSSISEKIKASVPALPDYRAKFDDLKKRLWLADFKEEADRIADESK